MPTKGLEPLHPKAHGPEPCASTNSATWALMLPMLLLYLTTVLRTTTKTTRCWWCPRRDSNPYTRRHMDLNHARLPIPPRGHCAAHFNCILLATVLRITTMNNLLLVVPTKGLEPLHPKAHGPEPCASTNSATWALLLLAACRCVFCSEDKIIRAGAHSVNQHFALFFKKHVFSPEKGFSL